MSETSILEQVGLTKRESEFYRLLLSRGESKVTSIQEKLGYHPQVVYRVARSLQEKGLVSVAKKRGVLHAVAESPRELVRREKERLTNLKEHLPDLLALQKGADAPFINVAKGDAALKVFRERAYRSLKKNDVYYVIGGSGDRFYTAMGESYKEIENIRIKRGIRKKVISNVGEQRKLQQDTSSELAEFRYLSDNHPIISSTNIFRETIAIIIWSEEPVILSVRSYEIATSYKQYFKQLWRSAS